MKVVGRKYTKWTNNDGKEMHGLRLFCTEPVEGVDGLSVEAIHLSEDKAGYAGACKNVVVGSEIKPVYNKYGKVDDIMVVK